MSTGVNIIRCRITGEGLAVQLGGGQCICPTDADCPFQPHSTTVSAAAFDAADSGSNPDVAANITATEIELRYKNIPSSRNTLVEGIVDKTFKILRKRGYIP